MIYATGHISGAHINPAVTLGFALSRHFPWKWVPHYWISQLAGATAACLVFSDKLFNDFFIRSRAAKQWRTWADNDWEATISPPFDNMFKYLVSVESPLSRRDKQASHTPHLELSSKIRTQSLLIFPSFSKSFNALTLSIPPDDSFFRWDKAVETHQVFENTLVLMYIAAAKKTVSYQVNK